MTDLTYEAKTAAEQRRIVEMLVALNIPCSWIPSDKKIIVHSADRIRQARNAVDFVIEYLYAEHHEIRPHHEATNLNPEELRRCARRILDAVA